ncbi:hypothetical protein [Ensifer sp. LC384]|nr:hypothetical protein [Ensifer sp. LC384]
MDNQQRQREPEEREKADPRQDDRPFDPWEEAFKRDFQKHEREFDF